MNVAHTIAPNMMEELKDTIMQAMTRVSAKKETDLCPYLPGKSGHLHHLVFGRLKKRHPTELHNMIKEHILEKESPKTLPSKVKPILRVSRQVEIKLKQSQVDRLVNILKKTGDQDLISMLAPHKSLSQVQKLMLHMIKQKEVDKKLWETYVSLIEEQRVVG